MRYLVIQNCGSNAVTQFSAISIVTDPEYVPPHPYKVWSLSKATSVIFATMKLHKLVKEFYLFGTMETMAKYLVPFDELCLIVEANIGPDDESNYHKSLEQLSALDRSRIERNCSAVTQYGFEALGLLFLIVKLFFKFVAFQTLLPLIIYLLRKPR